MTNVVYRATPQATQSVIAGETAFFFDSPASITHARSGAVRALAVTTPRRFPPFPDIPTVAEAGGPDISAEAWYGLFAPAATPPERLARLHAAFTGAIRRAEVVQRLNAMGFDAVANGAAEFAPFLAAESGKWREVIRAANIRLE
jgi:tripartite-type tricarboxylate transporter receptor subunit TctC